MNVSSWSRRLGSLVVVTGVAIAAFWASTNSLQIRDWWVLRSYEPPAAISALASSASLSDEGQHYFYASQPELDSKASFNQHCPTVERTLVLGCYAHLKIYVLNITDRRLQGVKEVTAAHEMLHAVYQRLDDGERERIDQLLIKQLKLIKDKKILKLVAQYRKQEPDALNDELHSILPTQSVKLLSELETYYDQYFVDRQVVVKAYQDYEAVFTAIQARVDRLNAKINASLKSINNDKQQADAVADDFSTTQTQASSVARQLDQMDKQLKSLQRSGQIAKYNAQVAEYNQLVAQYQALTAELESLQTDYNQLAAQINSNITAYNDLVDLRNKVAYQSTDLYHVLDSTYEAESLSSP